VIQPDFESGVLTVVPPKQILHAQRFFSAVLPRIMSGAQSTQGPLMSVPIGRLELTKCRRCVEERLSGCTHYHGSAHLAYDLRWRARSGALLTLHILVVSKASHNCVSTQMMPLLIRGLELPDLSLRLNVIQTLQTAATDLTVDATTLAERAPALAETMLKTAALTEPSALVSLNEVCRAYC